MRTKKKHGCLLTSIYTVLVIVAMSWFVSWLFPNTTTNLTTELKEKMFGKDSVAVDTIKVDTIKTDTIKPTVIVKEEVDKTIKVPIIVEPHATFVMVKVNGADVLFQLDTGCSSIQMTVADYQFLVSNRMMSESNLGGEVKCVYADGSEGTRQEVKIDSIDIGGVVIKNVSGTLEENVSTTRLLGQSVLSKLGTVSFDYKNKFLIIKE